MIRPLLTKPCARADRGCLGQCQSRTPSQHARKRFCSNRCAALARYEAGAKPPQTTHAQRVAGGRKGGLQAGKARRFAAAMRIRDELTRFITPDMELRWTASDLARVKALLARAWKAGHTVGRCTQRCDVAREGKVA